MRKAHVSDTSRVNLAAAWGLLALLVGAPPTAAAPAHGAGAAVRVQPQPRTDPPAPPPGPTVILAAHPDDETLGCGGLIARRSHEGRRVVVVVITDGRALLKRFGIDRDPSPAEVAQMRKEETRRAVDILSAGRAEILYLDIENERLVAEQADATRWVAALLGDLAPAELYVPSAFEGHAEHVAANQIARAACASTGACGSLFEYIVSLRRNVSMDTVPRRRVAVDVSAYRDLERQALAQFRSHLDVISPRLPAPLTPDYDRYLTDEEPFLVDR
jgi:N-acetylglucosamine malate deacetylase 1